MKIPKHTPEEALQRLQEAMEKAIGDLQPMFLRQQAVGPDEAMEAVLKDDRIIAYTAAIFGHLKGISILTEATSPAQMYAMFQLAIWLDLYKQDILNALGMEE